MSAPVSHPLVADYVVKKTRGKAVALAGIGLVGGEITAMGVLFQFTKDMSFKDAFCVAAMVTFAWSLFLLIAIKDPDMTKLQRKMDSKLLNSPDRHKEQPFRR
jgi:sugar phosphate permease